ncbi:MAG: LPS export ABC transporter permease LptG [Lysobacteraceae bacterium]|nr:MAG: LPS export ABC transporter permease LptG [Xanthomonadaceae bacterium]
MTPFPRIHDLYIGRVVFGSVLLTWAVLIGLDAIISGLLTEMSDVGTGRYDALAAATNVAFTLPRRAYMLFPTAAVIGALIGLGQLSASSELTVLRALGLSRRRISLSVILSLAVLTALMVINGETLGPWGQRRADMLKAAAKSNEVIIARYSGLWAREGETFLNAQTGQERSENGKQWLELNDVRLFELASDGRLVSVTHAGAAEHREGEWILRDVERTRFDGSSVAQTSVKEERWRSRLDAAALAANTRNLWTPRYMTSSELDAGIEYRRRNSLDSGEFEEHYWGRWFYPINVLALCLLAVPFAFGSLRSGGLGRRLFLGIIFSLGFWLLQTQFVRLAGVFKFDYRLAYTIPALVMIGLSLWLFKRRSG